MNDPKGHDPKGKVRIKLKDDIFDRGAEMSECKRYRRVLWRTWGTQGRTILWIGMNPSTADAEHDDPTCGREVTFSKLWGYDTYLKANVLDWRATFPKDIPTEPGIAASPEGRKRLLELAQSADQVMAAWGKLPPKLAYESQNVANLLGEAGIRLMCLGENKDGSPKHPLYLRKDLKPQIWSGSRA